jgi:hypothetical protein
MIEGGKFSIPERGKISVPIDIRETFRSKFYGSVEELQQDLDQWLHYYNYERPHRGYRNMGKRPIETIEEGKLVKEQVLKKAA